MQTIAALLHLKAMIAQLRQMQRMSTSDQEREAIADTLAQAYDRAAHLLYSIGVDVEREKESGRKLENSLPLSFSLSNSPSSSLTTHRYEERNGKAEYV